MLSFFYLLYFVTGLTSSAYYHARKIRAFAPRIEITRRDKLAPRTWCVCDAATLLKTEPGAMPDGKVKIRLESDGSLLDVDEDDVEKVFNHQISSGASSIMDEANVCMYDCVCVNVYV